MNSNYNTLNPMQREAVFTTDGPLLVLAGAGSGKTRALTHRIAYLIEEQGVNPWNILAITFTNKAAAEMRERVNQLVEFGAESIWVSTFHSLCVRILRRDAEAVGYDTDFVIYDTDDQRTLMRQIIKKLDLDPKMYKERSILAKISANKNELISPDAFSVEVSGDYRQMQIANCYQEYQAELRKNNAMDFDDLIMRTVELLEMSPEIRGRYQDRFRYIMVDEYQDTNTAQFKLISLLTGKDRNLCVVGDDDQSIYKFRGANIRNILDFEQVFPETRVIKLEQNYRSTQNILDIANEVIQNNYGRKEKRLWTANEQGSPVRFSQYDTAYDEANGIVREIRNAHEREGAPLKEWAILYRTNAQSRLLEERCIQYNIPYRLVGGVNFYQRKEIKDILAYLKTIQGGKDDLSVERIINIPKRGIGAATIGKVMLFASANGISFMEALERAERIPGIGKAKEKIDKFVRLIQVFRSQLEYENSISGLIRSILETSGYEEELAKDTEAEAEARKENLEELINKAADYENTAEEPSLSGFLEEVALVADVDQLDQSEDRITLMTLHGAKGLEFGRVYLAGLEEGLFPGSMAANSEDPSDLEEERRLFYVGVTRAKKELTLTCARTRMVNGENRYSRKSRFLDEIPPTMLKEKERERKPVAEASFGRSFERPSSYGTTDYSSRFGFGRGSYEEDLFELKKPDQKPAYGGLGRMTMDEIKQGRQLTSEQAGPPDYQIGDRVHHMKFGEGTVKDISKQKRDYEVAVEFDSYGMKRMYASFAKLKKI